MTKSSIASLFLFLFFLGDAFAYGLYLCDGFDLCGFVEDGFEYFDDDLKDEDIYASQPILIFQQNRDNLCKNLIKKHPPSYNPAKN